MLSRSIHMCNQLFKYPINQTASPWDKDVTESNIREPIISLTSAEGVLMFLLLVIHVSLVPTPSAVSHDILNPEVSIFFFFLYFQSSLVYLLLCLFVSICLHSAVLTLCLLTFAFCLSAHLSSVLSSYLSCLSDSNLLSVSVASNHTPSHSHMPSLNLHLFSAGDEPTHGSPAIVGGV